MVALLRIATDSVYMKAIIIKDSFGLENLTLIEREKEHLGLNSVRVQIQASSLNYRDYLMATGKYNPRLKLPLVPCSDGTGTVSEVGTGVTKFSVGDRVAGIFSQSWLDGPPEINSLRTTLGGPLDGMLQEERVLNEDGLVLVPDFLSPEEAATLPCAGLTAYNAVVTLGRAKPGSTVVVLGTGGVSLFALQFAKMVGARVIVTSSSDEKLQKAKLMGADETINYKTKENWDREIRKLTDKKGADLIIEVGGAGTLPKSMAAIRPGGTIALIGVLAGGEGSLSLYPILMQGVNLQGVIVGNRREFEEMNRAIEVNQIHPVVDSVFSIEKVKEAFRYLESGKHFGKVVVQV